MVNVPENVESAFNSSLNRVWSLAKEDTFEHLILLSKYSGKIIGEATGDREKVELPKVTFDEREVLLVHSHPNIETGVSLPDMLSSLGGEYPVYAITPSKSVTWVDGKRFGATALMGPEFFTSVLSTIFKNFHKKFIKLAGWPNDGLLNAEPGTNMDHYGILTHLASLTASTGPNPLMNYRFHFTPEIEARMDEASAIIGLPPCRSFSGWRNAPEVEVA